MLVVKFQPGQGLMDAPNVCPGYLDSRDSLYQQNIQRRSPAEYKGSHGHKALSLGENVWFHIFTAGKMEPKWKQGVIIG
jgi:hypothetical protein